MKPKGIVEGPHAVSLGVFKLDRFETDFYYSYVASADGSLYTIILLQESFILKTALGGLPRCECFPLVFYSHSVGPFA